MQARHWIEDIPLWIYVAVGFLGLALIVIRILFPLFVYRYLRQLVVAQEQTNKLLIIQLEQTRNLCHRLLLLLAWKQINTLLIIHPERTRPSSRGSSDVRSSGALSLVIDPSLSRAAQHGLAGLQSALPDPAGSVPAFLRSAPFNAEL